MESQRPTELRPRLATIEDINRGFKALEAELDRRKRAGEPSLTEQEAVSLFRAVVHYQEPPDEPSIV
jgi:hypothetical protein